MQLLTSLLTAIVITSSASGFATCLRDNGIQTEANYSQSIQQSNDVSQSTKTSAEWLIVPGKSAGQTHINENMITVFKRLGKPDAGDAAMGKSMSIWYAGHDSKSYKTAIFAARYTHGANDTASLAQQILVTSPRFRLSNGIRTGLPYQQIAAKYKLTKSSAFGKGSHQLKVYNTGKGISFEFNSAHKCTGIYIHAVKYQSNAAYLAFHPELERMK